MRHALLALSLATLALPATAQEHPAMTPAALAADRARFPECLADLAREAARQGVPRALAERELALFEPDMRLIELMRGQPEFERPLWQYISTLVTDARVSEGREMLARHRDLLEHIRQRTGVQPQVLVALWGIETNFGRNLGQRPLLRSTATLACIGRRKEFFRAETLAALKVVAQGHIASADLRGSWAGAFGHMQFMPTTFLAHAVDFDGDGRRDLIGSVADALASTATRLQHDGWEVGKTWGYEIELSPRFPLARAGRDELTLAQWQALGARRPDGQPFPRPGDRARLLLPAGARGPAFLVLHNFHALRRYNGSEAYAFALGHLADRIVGGDGFRQPWPTDVAPLSRAERQELQQLLTHLGFDTGGTDGKIGTRTRDALRDYQIRAGVTADGFPTPDMLRHLRQRAALN